jgi:uncharacterized protein YycO
MPESVGIVNDFLPGDHLLYSGQSFFARLIKLKTWSRYSHIEIYIGNSLTVTSRDGIGVRIFPFIERNLVTVLRPHGSLDLSKGIKWLDSVVNQKYDWWGILRFFNLGKESQNKQFCSEFCTRFDRACGFKPFAEWYDADKVSPGMFHSSPNFTVIWEKK